MFDFILDVLIGASITMIILSFVYGCSDEITQLNYNLDIDFINTCKKDSRELRIIPRLIILSIIYSIELSYYSGVYFVKYARKIFRFILIKN